MKKYLLVPIIILLHSCKDAVKKDADIHQQITASESLEKKAMTNKIDSIKRLGFTIYSSFNFIDMTGIEYSKHETKFPLLAYKKEEDSIRMLSILSSKIIIRRCIKKDSNSNRIERTKEFIFDKEEIMQSTYILNYKKDKIVVFDVKEFIKSTKENKFFLNSIYFFYQDSIIEYHQGNNTERMLNKPLVDYTISELELDKVFTSNSKIYKEIFIKKNNYSLFREEMLLKYLMK